MASYQEKLSEQLDKKREKLMKRPVGVVSAFVLGSSSVGAPKCLYVHTDHDRYLFNAGEGSQRLAQELKLKLRRVRNIFITNESWETLSGLPGIGMALRDLGVRDVNIFGPSNFRYIFSETASFVRLQGLSMNGRICESGGSFEDEAIKILFAVMTTAAGDRAVCYVILPKERRRKLDPQRCQQMGVPKGPMYGILKSGGEVTIDGRVITSAEVTLPSEEPLVMLVVDAPKPEFIPLIEQCPILSEHANARIVVHFTPLQVMRNPAYIRWMQERLQPTAAHLLVNEAAAYGTAGVAARQQMLLHQLVPEAFPLLRLPSVLESEETGDGGPDEPRQHDRSGFDDVIPPPNANEIWRSSFPDVQNLVAARPLLEYRLKPPSKFNVLRCPILDLPKESSRIQEQIAKAQHTSLQNLRNALRESGKARHDMYPCLLFTGTGGAVPSPMRNTAGILINLRDKSILMDCAEGTLGQLIRMLGPQQMSQVLSNIKAIFISHPHADHTLGLPTLLQAISHSARSSAVNIIAPRETNYWLSSCARRRFCDANSFRSFNTGEYLVYGIGCLEVIPYEPESLAVLLGVSEATLGTMVHCPDSYGIAIKNSDEKITYSGDTAPNEDLVRIGRNTDILINEATLGTVLPGLAQRKKHCTTQNALDLAQRMNARHTFLTHFSTRYARIPQLLDLQNATNTIIAFDNMMVCPSLLEVLSEVIRPLSEIYSDKLQRIRKKERRQY